MQAIYANVVVRSRVHGLVQGSGHFVLECLLSSQGLQVNHYLKRNLSLSSLRCFMINYSNINTRFLLNTLAILRVIPSHAFRFLLIMLRLFL